MSELVLKTTILALIDRKMKLLAELDVINSELIGAYSILGEIPSLGKTLATADKTPVPVLVKRKKGYDKNALYTQVCKTCKEKFQGKRTKHYCPPCYSSLVSERMKTTHRKQGHVVRSIEEHYDEIIEAQK